MSEISAFFDQNFDRERKNDINKRCHTLYITDTPYAQ